jgi:hypothetical protein
VSKEWMYLLIKPCKQSVTNAKCIIFQHNYQFFFQRTIRSGSQAFWSQQQRTFLAVTETTQLCEAAWTSSQLANLCPSKDFSVAQICNNLHLFAKELPDLHTRPSPTQSDTYHMLYWYNWLSWWCARYCSKHVQNWNKHILGSFQKFCTLYVFSLKMNLFYKIRLQAFNVISIVLYNSGPTFGQVLYSCLDAFVVEVSNEVTWVIRLINNEGVQTEI